MKYCLTLLAAISLSACMDMDGGDVSRAATGVSSCAHLGGMAAEYLQGSNLRCGPQTELPYTVR